MSNGSQHNPVHRVNDHHADDLLVVARAFSGHPDVISARAEQIDDYGIDLILATPMGPARARIGFAAFSADTARGRRAGFADLAERARAALASHNESDAS